MEKELMKLFESLLHMCVITRKEYEEIIRQTERGIPYEHSIKKLNETLNKEGE